MPADPGRRPSALRHHQSCRVVGQRGRAAARRRRSPDAQFASATEDQTGFIAAHDLADIRRRRKRSPRTSSSCGPLKPSLTLFIPQGLVKSAQQLVVSFLFDDGNIAPPLASSSSEHNSTLIENATRSAASAAWRQAVQEVVDRKDQRSSATGRAADPMGVTTENRMPPRHIVLKFLPHLTVAGHHRRLENVIYGTGYLLVALYVWRYIRKLRAHSKLGLLVTGCVELAASGIMSVSICWLLGWSLGLVPW